MKGKLRIISGKWRRRVIRFGSSLDIRPTTDAARETLFNWLQRQIEGAKCLDLYAGSGALGFEALSRGAESAVFVDINRRCIRSLHQTAAELSANQCLVVCSEAMAYLKTIEEKFDVVFVDPPFYRDMALSSVELLESIGCLNSNAHVYVEMERSEGLNQLSEQWEILRHYQSGSRSHYLLQFVQN